MKTLAQQLRHPNPRRSRDNTSCPRRRRTLRCRLPTLREPSLRGRRRQRCSGRPNRREAAPSEKYRQIEIGEVRHGRAPRDEHRAHHTHYHRRHRVCHCRFCHYLPALRSKFRAEVSDPSQETRSHNPGEQTAVVQVQVVYSVHALTRQRLCERYGARVFARVSCRLDGGQLEIRVGEGRVRFESPGEKRDERRRSDDGSLATIHRQELSGVGQSRARSKLSIVRIKIRNREHPSVLRRRGNAQQR